MKKASRFIVVLTVFFVIFATFTCFCSAAAQTEYVFDDGGLLTDAQESALTEKAKAISEKYSATVAVITAPSGISYANFSYGNYPELDTSGRYLIMVVTHSDTWHYDLEWDGLKLSQSEADAVLDASAVYGNLKSGRIYQGLDAYLDLVEPKLYTPFSRILAFGLICGAVITAVTVSVIVASYRLKTKPQNYPLDQYASLKLTESKEIFLSAHTTHYVRSSGSRGGGGGGHLGGRHSGR